MSINSMKTQCYKITKKDGRYHLFDKDYVGNNFLIPIKDWKQMRGLYEYLEKQHKANYTMKEIQKIVKTSSNGVFLLDNDESEDEEQVKKSVTKNEELLKIENAELKNEIDKLNKIIIQLKLNQKVQQVEVEHSKPINIPICPNNKQQKPTRKKQQQQIKDCILPILNKNVKNILNNKVVELLLNNIVDDIVKNNNINIVAKDFVNKVINSGVNKIKKIKRMNMMI